MAERRVKQIGIAIVEFEGRYLVGVRKAGQDLAGFAEFPGGKCEADEQPEECAARECFEETGLAVTPVRLLDRTQHEYAHAAVDLHFWLCRAEGVSGELQRSEPVLLNGFEWKTVEQLRSLSFPEANVGILEKLIN